MALIAYDGTAAGAYAEARRLPADGLGGWREAVDRHLRPRAGMRVLDLGAGTGTWTRAFADWYGVRMVPIEPSAAMRARAGALGMVGADAAALPLADGCLDGAWVSTVVHHLPDLPAVAAELRRVLRPGAPVLIRSAFAGRHAGISLFRYFPEAIQVLDGFPSVAEVTAAFASAGFAPAAFRPVPQVTADSLAAAAQGLRREAHTPLVLIGDAEYERGVARLAAAAARSTGPVVDSLDLLVLR